MLLNSISSCFRDIAF